MVRDRLRARARGEMMVSLLLVAWLLLFTSNFLSSPSPPSHTSSQPTSTSPTPSHLIPPHPPLHSTHHRNDSARTTPHSLTYPLYTHLAHPPAASFQQAHHVAIFLPACVDSSGAWSAVYRLVAAISAGAHVYSLDWIGLHRTGLDCSYAPRCGTCREDDARRAMVLA